MGAASEQHSFTISASVPVSRFLLEFLYHLPCWWTVTSKTNRPLLFPSWLWGVFYDSNRNQTSLVPFPSQPHPSTPVLISSLLISTSFLPILNLIFFHLSLSPSHSLPHYSYSWAEIFLKISAHFWFTYLLSDLKGKVMIHKAKNKLLKV